MYFAVVYMPMIKEIPVIAVRSLFISENVNFLPKNNWTTKRTKPHHLHWRDDYIKESYPTNRWKKKDMPNQLLFAMDEVAEEQLAEIKTPNFFTLKYFAIPFCDYHIATFGC